MGVVYLCSGSTPHIRQYDGSSFGTGTANNRRWPIVHVRRETARGRFLVREPVAMRRPAQVPLDRMKFPLSLAGGLRTAFADVVSTPLPGRLAALMRRVRVDRDER